MAASIQSYYPSLNVVLIVCKNGGFSSTPEANDVVITTTSTECNFSFHKTSKFENGFLYMEKREITQL